MYNSKFPTHTKTNLPVIVDAVPVSETKIDTELETKKTERKTLRSAIDKYIRKMKETLRGAYVKPAGEPAAMPTVGRDNIGDRYAVVKSYGIDTCCVSVFPLRESKMSGGFRLEGDALIAPASAFYYFGWDVYVSRADGDCVLTLALRDKDEELVRLNATGFQSGSRVVWINAGEEIRVCAYDERKATGIDDLDLLAIHIG